MPLITYREAVRHALAEELERDANVVVTAASASFLQRVFGGALKPMLTHFVAHQELTPAELKELEDLLARKKRRR